MTPKPYHCRHLFTDGHQCGSPALRGEPLCYYHHAARRPDQLRTLAGDAVIALPEPTALHAVQRGLAELLRLTVTGAVDEPRARILLRILANAGNNLARIDRQTAAALKADPARAPVQDYVLDLQRGTLAPAPLGQPAQPLEPEPRPEGPLPDPVTRLSLKPAIELVRDPLLEAFKQQQAEALYREAEQQAASSRAAYEATQAALTPAQRERQRQTARNRFPPSYHPAFDELTPRKPPTPSPTPTQLDHRPQHQHEVLPEVQTQPQPNQDFGILENPRPPQPPPYEQPRSHQQQDQEHHLACA